MTRDEVRYTSGVGPTELLRTLLDPDRLAVIGAITRAPATSAQVAAVGVEVDDVVRTLAPLVQARLVVRHATPDGDAYVVDASRWRSIADQLPQDPPLDPRVGFGMTADERAVLARFFVGDRLEALPAQRRKRLVVLERLALEFDAGRRYPEAAVNERLGAFHPDHSSLRRALVDEGFLDREPGTTDQGRSTVVYWRSGGRVT